MSLSGLLNELECSFIRVIGVLYFFSRRKSRNKLPNYLKKHEKLDGKSASLPDFNYFCTLKSMIIPFLPLSQL